MANFSIILGGKGRRRGKARKEARSSNKPFCGGTDIRATMGDLKRHQAGGMEKEEGTSQLAYLGENDLKYAKQMTQEYEAGIALWRIYLGGISFSTGARQTDGGISVGAVTISHAALQPWRIWYTALCSPATVILIFLAPASIYYHCTPTGPRVTATAEKKAYRV